MHSLSRLRSSCSHDCESSITRRTSVHAISIEIRDFKYTIDVAVDEAELTTGNTPAWRWRLRSSLQGPNHHIKTPTNNSRRPHDKSQTLHTNPKHYHIRDKYMFTFAQIHRIIQTPTLTLHTKQASKPASLKREEQNLSEAKKRSMHRPIDQRQGSKGSKGARGWRGRNRLTHP